MALSALENLQYTLRQVAGIDHFPKMLFTMRRLKGKFFKKGDKHGSTAMRGWKGRSFKKGGKYGSKAMRGWKRKFFKKGNKHGSKAMRDRKGKSFEKLDTYGLKDHRDTIEAVVAGSDGEGGLIETELRNVETLSNAEQCQEMTYLGMQEVVKLAKLAFKEPEFTIHAPRCSDSIISNPAFGDACRYETLYLFRKLYDTGLFYLALGASAREAFVPFQHARAIAWNLHLCHPYDKSKKYILLPNSYAALYDIYTTTLMARLKQRSGGSLSKQPSEKDLSEIISEYKVRRDRATTLRLSEFIKPDIHFPPSTTLTSLSIRDDNDFSEHDFESSTYLEEFPSLPLGEPFVETVEGLKMTEDHCNGGDNAMTYHVFLLHDMMLKSRFEVCCARECDLLHSNSRLFGSKRTCCIGCNRYNQCRIPTEEDRVDLARMSTVTAFQKIDSEPEVISILSP